MDICCIGHITLDRVVTEMNEVFMPGGTAWYLSNALSNINVKYNLVTALAEPELKFVSDLQSKGIDVTVFPCRETVFFENIYSENQDHRTQRVKHKAAPFHIGQLSKASAKIFHLGALLADDIPLDVIQYLSAKGSVSVDAQGFLREVQNEQVIAVDWQWKEEALKHIDILKANDAETEVLTGTSNLREGAKILAALGVKEVVITLGSKGSIIYADNTFYEIPAFRPSIVTDATGCGDTYMAGYLYQRAKAVPIQQAGEFAAAMASLKIEASGPFNGTEPDVSRVLNTGVRTFG